MKSSKIKTVFAALFVLSVCIVFCGSFLFLGRTKNLGEVQNNTVLSTEAFDQTEEPEQEPTMYTVTLVSNGGNWAEDKAFSVEENTDFNLLAVSVYRPNYVLYSWNEMQDGSGRDYLDTIKIENNVTLYAKWQSTELVIDENNVSSQAYENRSEIKLEINLLTEVRIEWVIFLDGQRIACGQQTSRFSYMPTKKGTYNVYARVLNTNTASYTFTVDWAKITSISIETIRLDEDNYKFTAITNDQSDSSKVEWFQYSKGDSKHTKIGEGRQIVFRFDKDDYYYIYCKSTETDCISENLLLKPPINLSFLLPLLIIFGVAFIIFIPAIIKRSIIRKREM